SIWRISLSSTGIALSSPETALFTICLARASSLVILRRLPFSVATMRESSSAWIAVAKFLDPFGRPLGLPDWPGLNRLAPGGLLYPTGSPFPSDMAGLHPPAPLREGGAARGVGWPPATAPVRS